MERVIFLNPARARCLNGLGDLGGRCRRLGGECGRNLLLAPVTVNGILWWGNVVFETAPANGATPGAWTAIYSEAWNTSAVPLSAVSFELKAGTWTTEVNNPGTVKFDNFKAAKP